MTWVLERSRSVREIRCWDCVLAFDEDWWVVLGGFKVEKVKALSMEV